MTQTPPSSPDPRSDPRRVFDTIPEPEREASTGRLRDPGGPGMALLAWAVVLGMVGLILWMHSGAGTAPQGQAGGAPQHDVPVNAISEMLGRYIVGASSLTPANGPMLAERMTESLPESAATEIRAAIVLGEVVSAERALERLDALLQSAPAAPSPDEAPAEAAGGAEAAEPSEIAESAVDADASNGANPAMALTPELRDDIALLREIYTGVDVPRDVASHTDFVDRHGWYGRLGLSHGLPDSDALRSAAIGAAVRTSTVLLLATLGAVGVAVAGLCVAIVAVVMAAKGRVRAAYRPPAPGGSVFIETVAIFFVGLLAVQALAAAIQGPVTSGAPAFDLSYLLIWLLPPIALWPVLRGMHFSTLRFAMGWHSGRGVFREIGAGVMGYLAGVPIFALGIGLTLLLMLVRDILSLGESEPPTHPIMDAMGKGGLIGYLVLLSLAAVWAPLAEESIFRGAFYHHLRGRMSPFISMLVTGFVFAVVHPQGLVAVPALMSLGVIFAMMREWRGSLIAPMTAHALHNGTIITIVTLALT